MNNTKAVAIAGIDAGFGETKAVVPVYQVVDSESVLSTEEIVFPSVYGYARELGWDRDRIMAKYPGDQIVDGQGSWFVGDLAHAQLPTAELFDLQGRDEANLERIRLIKVALGKLFSGCLSGDAINIRLTTGLPVKHMKDAPDLKAMLMGDGGAPGQHVIETDQANFIANIVDVSVMPQPYGTIYSNTLTTAGKQNTEALNYKVVGVADIGRYTFDIAVDDNGEYIDAESDSVESGAHLAHQAIADLIENKYGQKPKPKDVYETLRTGVFSAYGEDQNYKKQVAEALHPVRTAALNLMRKKWKKALHINVIYLCGGPAPLIYDVVKAEFRQTVLIPNSQFANARGYLNYALWKCQQ